MATVSDPPADAPDVRRPDHRQRGRREVAL